MTFVAEEPSKVPLSIQAVGHSEVMQFMNRGPNVFMRFRPNVASSGMVIGSSNVSAAELK